MTMDKPHKIAAGEFKARCLALLDEVAETGHEIIVTKRVKPVARLIPLEPEKLLRRSVRVLGDIVGPVDDPDDWKANRK